MRVITGALVFAVVVVLNSIELSSQASGESSSGPDEDEELVRENVNGEMSHIKCMWLRRSGHISPILRTLNRGKIEREVLKLDGNTVLIQKGQLIIAWYNAGKIAPLFDENDKVAGISLEYHCKILLNSASRALLNIGGNYPPPSLGDGTGRAINKHRRTSSETSGSDDTSDESWGSSKSASFSGYGSPSSSRRN